MHVRGTVRGKQVTGLGVLERSGYASYEDLEGFFEEVGKVVRHSVERVLPRQPDYKQARSLIASEAREQYMRGVDVDQYARTHIHPIREIVDRGGKGWRSYAAITCIDIVGGDSRKFVEWIALPELMHVGSLIVDDVEDKSETRRGGKTAHLMYGEGQAINSGTAAYFIGIHLLDSKLISDGDKLRTYDLYFEALRAGHAGQAIDIDGFEYMLPEVVKSGDSALLEERVMAVHRLKTAAPAGCLARMGAIAGGGTEAQIEGLGRFFEDLGLAFQIIDDVLNLRGFKGNLKAKAEDIVQGKVTLPVAKALSRLPKREREWLWDTLQDQAGRSQGRRRHRREARGLRRHRSLRGAGARARGIGLEDARAHGRRLALEAPAPRLRLVRARTALLSAAAGGPELPADRAEPPVPLSRPPALAMTVDEKKLLLVAVISGVPWVACLVHLWTRRGASFWARAAWSVALCMPIIGPLMYSSLFRRLAPHGPSTRPVAGQGGVPYSRILPPDDR